MCTWCSRDVPTGFAEAEVEVKSRDSDAAAQLQKIVPQQANQKMYPSLRTMQQPAREAQRLYPNWMHGPVSEDEWLGTWRGHVEFKVSRLPDGCLVYKDAWDCGELYELSSEPPVLAMDLKGGVQLQL